MIKKFIFLFLFLPSLCFGAITERYVTSTGTDTYANSTNIATPMSLTTAFANAAAGDRINIKADATYTRTANDTPTNSGTATSPIIYRGYSSTIGDGNLGRTNGNGALITTNMPLISYNATFRLIGTSANFVIWESLNFSANVSASTTQFGANALTKSCKAINVSTNSAAAAITQTSTSGTIFDCDAELTGASGGSGAIVCTCRVLFNRVKGGPAVGIIARGSVVIGNVVFASGTNGIAKDQTGNVNTILGNTIVGNTGDGYNVITGSTVQDCIVGNLITDNTGDGIDMVSTANAAFAAYNRTRDNANGYNNAGDWLTATKYGDVTTDTGGPETDYTASGSNNYSLISTSPAKAAGWMPYSSIGALQRQESTSGATKIPSI